MSNEASKAPANSEGDSAPFDWRNDLWRGRQFFTENRNKNVEKLANYAGQVVVWYPDGHDIWGAGPDEVVLWKRLEAAGEETWAFVFEWVEPPGFEGYV
jgi:hypothetical protein